MEEFSRWSVVVLKNSSKPEHLRVYTWLIISIRKDHYKLQDVEDPNYIRSYYKEYVHSHYTLSLRNTLKKL